MHVVFRESHGLDDTDTPTDLGQTPADLVVLSFSDSDLGAFAAAWHRGNGPDGGMPTLRLANLAALKHPLSVDTYVEQTLEGAKGILIRLIGGVPYWSYGLQQVYALAQERGIALAVLPADGREDTRLDDMSTLPVSTLRRLSHLCDTGGTVAAQAALAQLALAAGLYAGPVIGSKTLPQVGAWTPETGVTCPATAAMVTDGDTRPLIALVFYRSYLVSADLAPIEALYRAVSDHGMRVVALFAPSLKAPGAAEWLTRQITALTPDAVVNATAFSGKGASGQSPLDACSGPVFQVALSTSDRAAWAGAERGLSPADLAMHVVLPEVDGRLFAGVISFKEKGNRDPHLECALARHTPDTDRIAAVTARVKRQIDLRRADIATRRSAIILSTYPGKSWNMAHAVGLDALASGQAILDDLAAAGHDIATGAPLDQALTTNTVAWPLANYHAALAHLPADLREDLMTVWGDPAEDPALRDGAFHFPVTRRGKALVALQPERGTPKLREDEYHDLGRTPRHGYVAFYLWLRDQCDAVIHVGAHGTLEWLPGKAVALSAACWPEALIGDLPVIYPFIVNDPGEAAQAKRRIGALTIGHMPPPLRNSGTPDRFARLETLLDEFSNADGLDPKRRDRLQQDIRDEAQAIGVETDLGLDTATSTAEAITRIDRFVCDVKESQFGDGLHIFGRAPEVTTDFDADASARGERTALITALRGGRVEAGPAGSPYRGRRDVLPTGRNLFTTDPRAVPSRAAYAQGVKLAEELVRRHLQDQGDWPRGVVVDLWGSATMRTAGEEFAMALHLLGVRPIWDKGSERVSGIEVLPLAEMDRPRIDVTLRVSGLFRDVFPTLSSLFAKAVRVLAARDEAPDWNPYVGRDDLDRVYGPAPGQFGLNMGPAIEDYSDEGRAAAGAAWLAASSWAIDGGQARRDAGGIAARVAGADSFIHVQDMPETDLLLAEDYAAHEAGFAAAQAAVGAAGRANLYHMDSTNPATPRMRSLTEEIARVVQARATHPGWLAGMARHGYRGAAEIAATLDHMAAFAHLAGVVPAHLFDAYYDATLGAPDITAFMEQANPDALAAMRDRFAALHSAGIWQTRRNSILAELEMGQ